MVEPSGIDGYSGSDEVRQALRRLSLAFTRPGELRMAEYEEFDIVRTLWTIPAERMKRKQNGNLIVPLSKQAPAIAKDVQKVTGNMEGRQLLFP